MQSLYYTKVSVGVILIISETTERTEENMKLKAKTANLIMAVAAIVLGVAILILTKVQGLELVKSAKMGPGFFPMVCGIAIIVCGILMLLELNTQNRRAKTDKAEAAEMEKGVLDPRELRNLLVFAVLGIGVLLLSKYIGLLTSLGLCVIAYLKIQGKDSWLKSIIIGVCMVVFLYLVFVLFLHVPVPKGPLGF